MDARDVVPGRFPLPLPPRLSSKSSPPSCFLDLARTSQSLSTLTELSLATAFRTLLDPPRTPLFLTAAPPPFLPLHRQATNPLSRKDGSDFMGERLTVQFRTRLRRDANNFNQERGAPGLAAPLIACRSVDFRAKPVGRSVLPLPFPRIRHGFSPEALSSFFFWNGQALLGSRRGPIPSLLPVRWPGLSLPPSSTRSC